MNLYKVSQDINNNYDTYDSMVVAAESEQGAREIHPSEYCTHISRGMWMGTYAYTARDKAGQEYVYEDEGGYSSWVPLSRISELKVEFLGETHLPKGVVLASFNAG